MRSECVGDASESFLESIFQTDTFWPLSSKSTTKHLVSPSKTSYQISIITPPRVRTTLKHCCEVTPEQIKKAMESQMAEDDQKLYEVPVLSRGKR